MGQLPAVLAYHKVHTPELGGTWCTRRQLRAHVAALGAAGFKAVDFATFERRLDALQDPANVPDPGREVLFTFDDGFASFADHGWPELQQSATPAVVFVITEYVGRRASWDWPLPGRRPPHLDWPALRALAAAGVTIGSHAATHRDLRRLSAVDLSTELYGTRLRLEDALGVRVASVAYPFGRCDARVARAARDAGYACGFSVCPPGTGVERFALRRFGVYVIDGPRAVLDKADVRRPGHAWQAAAGRAINASAGLVSGAPRSGRPQGHGSRLPDR